MSDLEFDKFRESDGTLNISAMTVCHQGKPLTDAQKEYVKDIEGIRPIKSRQLAAIVVATLVRYDR